MTGSKEEARHEVASYASSCANGLYRSIFKRNTPEAQELYRRLEKKSPGIVDEFRNIHENFNPYEHESLHAKHKHLASQRVIDTINLSGPVEDIDEKIYDLHELGPERRLLRPVRNHRPEEQHAGDLQQHHAPVPIGVGMTTTRPAFLTEPFAAYYHRDVPEEDAELTHTGPGTPCGEYLRRFWQPVAYSADLKDLPSLSSPSWARTWSRSGTRAWKCRTAGDALRPPGHFPGIRRNRGARDTVLLPRLAI